MSTAPVAPRGRGRTRGPLDQTTLGLVLPSASIGGGTLVAVRGLAVEAEPPAAGPPVPVQAARRSSGARTAAPAARRRPGAVLTYRPRRRDGSGARTIPR